MKKLEDIPKENQFKVPENYFESLENKIAERIEKEKSIKKISPFDIFKPYMYMAACVIILTFGLKGFLLLVDKKTDAPIGKTQTEETIEPQEYYDNLISDLSSDDLTLYEYLNDETDQEYADTEIINSDEDLAYVEEYLSQYYLEYELLYE
jgi:hypothetical protein